MLVFARVKHIFSRIVMDVKTASRISNAIVVGAMNTNSPVVGCSLNDEGFLVSDSKILVAPLDLVSATRDSGTGGRHFSSQEFKALRYGIDGEEKVC